MLNGTKKTLLFEGLRRKIGQKKERSPRIYVRRGRHLGLRQERATEVKEKILRLGEMSRDGKGQMAPKIWGKHGLQTLTGESECAEKTLALACKVGGKRG